MSSHKIPVQSDRLPNLNPIRTVANVCAPMTLLSIVVMTALLHKALTSRLYLHSHFISKLWLWALRFLMPRPTLILLVIREFQLTKWIAFLSWFPCHMKSLLKVSILFLTLQGKGNRDITYVGNASKKLFTNNTLPPRDKYCLFQIANLFSHLSSFNYPIHISWALYLKPKYNPK